MSSVLKQAGPRFPSPRSDKKQLQRDRWTAFVVLSIVVAMMALLVWLASLGGGVANEGIDYWHMMP